jgi:hypothetical protein
MRIRWYSRDMKTTNRAANDTRSNTRGAGRDVRKALEPMRSALDAGDMCRVRNAAKYAWRRLAMAVAMPTSDASDIWANTHRVLAAVADELDEQAVAHRQAAS